MRTTQDRERRFGFCVELLLRETGIIGRQAMVRTNERFFVTGGNLPPDAPSYVRRQADHDLLNALHKGEFCYILTSRQMGKSSLTVRTALRLREEGAAVAVLEL